MNLSLMILLAVFAFLVTERYIAILESTYRSLFHTFTCMLSQAVREILSKSAYHCNEEHAFRCRIVNIFSNGYKGYPVFCQLLECFESNSKVSAPSIQGVNNHYI